MDQPFARVSDARYVLSYLIGMQEVDPHRVGVYGHSYGGRSRCILLRLIRRCVQRSRFLARATVKQC